MLWLERVAVNVLFDVFVYYFFDHFITYFRYVICARQEMQSCIFMIANKHAMFIYSCQVNV